MPSKPTRSLNPRWFSITRPQAALTVLVIVPMVVVCLLALRSLHSETVIAQSRLQSHADYTLQQLGQVLDSTIDVHATHQFMQIKNFLLDFNRIRVWTLNNNSVHFVSIYDLTGQQKFPQLSEYQSVNEVFFQDTLRSSITAGFRNGAFTQRHKDLLHDSTGVYLVVCDQLTNHVVCIVFTQPQVFTWWDEALSQTTLAGVQKVTLSLPGFNRQLQYVNSTSQNDVSRSAIIKPMTGLFRSWSAEVTPLANQSRAHPTLVYFALMSAVVTLLLGSGYGLLQFERTRARQLKDQTRFSAELAHELRTPLTNIRLYVDLVKHGTKDDIHKNCAVIESEIDRLSLLVDNAILLSKPGANRADQRLEYKNINDLIVHAVNLYQPLIGSSLTGVNTKLQCDTLGWVDADALQRVLINLLDNSRKYAQGSDVLIAAKCQANQLLLTYRDFGPGISLEKWRFIARLDAARPFSNGKGFGLGLRVCIRLCQQAGGKIDLVPTETGSTFNIQLPIKYHHENTDSRR